MWRVCVGCGGLCTKQGTCLTCAMTPGIGHAGSAIGIRSVEAGNEAARADADVGKAEWSECGESLTHEFGSEDSAGLNYKVGCSCPIIDVVSGAGYGDATPTVAGILFDEDGSVDSCYASVAVCMTG